MTDHTPPEVRLNRRGRRIAAQDPTFWGFGPAETPTPTKKGTVMDDINENHATDTPEAADDLADVTEQEYRAAAAQLAQEANSVQDGTPEAGDADEADGTPREARYRHRARVAEADRDRLTTIVEGMRRSEVERLAAPRLADPADVFRDGATLADVLDEEGGVDPGKLDGVIDELIGQHPHWRAPIVAYGGPLLSGASNSRQIDAPSKGFAAAFAPRTE